MQVGMSKPRRPAAAVLGEFRPTRLPRIPAQRNVRPRVGLTYEDLRQRYEWADGQMRTSAAHERLARLDSRLRGNDNVGEDRAAHQNGFRVTPGMTSRARS
ncbi:hypothetical protein TRIP_C20844 [Candidatus Zixiibacteriota bacterium]|nr:hypothetical protein TRIP_C20844 [candidate division Zixibacteria bacterium]